MKDDSASKVFTADIARVLDIEVDTMSGEMNVFDHGMDSLRLMMLVEQWRARGVHADFPRLAGEARLSDWLAVLTAERPTTADDPLHRETGDARV
jgi:aryl carrier-like protein